MFIGHYAPAFVAATSRKAPPLAVLMIGTQLIDFGFFGFALLGIEHFRMVPGITASNWLDLYDMPYTHSLLGTGVWAAGFAALVWLVTHRPAAAGLAAMAVVSHWLVDLLVHRPDLTLAGSQPFVGLGLWNLPVVEKPLELALAFGSLTFYAARARPKALPLAVLALVLALCQAIDWFGPRSIEVTTSQPVTALAAYTVIAGIAFWVESSRAKRT
jgi:hypothetical protein